MPQGEEAIGLLGLGKPEPVPGSASTPHSVWGQKGLFADPALPAALKHEFVKRKEENSKLAKVFGGSGGGGSGGDRFANMAKQMCADLPPHANDASCGLTLAIPLQSTDVCEGHQNQQAFGIRRQGTVAVSTLLTVPRYPWQRC